MAIIYYNNLVCHFLSMKDFVKAENWLWYMKDLIDHSKHINREKQQYEDVYLQKQCIFGMANGVYDGAEQIINSMFNNAQNELQRVSAKYILGQIYSHDLQPEKAKNAFEYVVAHGNKLVKVNEAKCHLAELG